MRMYKNIIIIIDQKWALMFTDQAAGMKKKRSRPHNKGSVNLGDMGKEVLDNLDENSQVVKQFRGYAAELDDKHDRIERIVKISRDITIESKRIIFLLHTLDKKEKQDAVLTEAESRLENVCKTSFKSIAKELHGHDVYQYIRAYKSGVQEFIEAITFHQYLQGKDLQNWTEIEKSFNYPLEENPKNSIEVKSANDQEVETTNNVEVENPNDQVITNSSDQNKMISTPLIPQDYILGIADLTGELMRKCINNLAFGNIAGCFETCSFVRNMYQGFLGCVGISGKEINRKLVTLKQSLSKIENVCYTIKIRGSEIPKHMLATVAIADVEENAVDDDEGYHY